MAEGVPTDTQQWELANSLFVPTDAEVVYRDAVAGPGSPKWVTGGDAIILNYPPPTATHGLTYKELNAYAVFLFTGAGVQSRPVAPHDSNFAFGNTTYDPDDYVVAGIKLDNQALELPGDSPMRRFERLFVSLNPLINYNPAANDVASRRTFWNTEPVIIGVGKWANHWANEFNRYADEMNVESGNWEGSAAGQFAALLREFEKLLREVHREINPGGSATSVPRAIGDGVLAMEKALNELYKGHAAFYSSDGMWLPSYQVFDALQEHYKGVDNVVRIENDAPVFKEPRYDPRNSAMWDAVDAEAKRRWLERVKDILDPVGKSVLGVIRSQYGASAEVFAGAKFNPEPRLAPPTSNSTSGGGNVKTEIDKLQDDYEKYIEKLTDKYEKIIADLEENLREQRDEFEEILGKNNDDNQNAIKKLESDYDRILKDLQDDMRAQKESYDEIIKNLNGDNRADIDKLKEDYERIIDGLKDDLTTQKDDFQKLLGGGGGGPPPVDTVNGGPVLLPSLGNLTPATRTQLQYRQGNVLGPDGKPVLDDSGAPVLLPPAPGSPLTAP